VEPEIATSVSSKKKFLMIALVVVLVAVGLAGFLFMQKETLAPNVEGEPVVQENKISPEDSAKLQILKDLAMNASTSTTLEAEKLRILKNLQTKAPASVSSDADKIKILQSLAGQ